MPGILNAHSALTVGQKALVSAGIAVLAVVAGVAVTAVFTSLPAALLVWGGAVAALMAAAFLAPLRLHALRPRPDPAADYDAAVARFRADAMPAPQPLNPVCTPQLLTHGQRTATAVVLLHGISSCPRAFVDLAPMLHASGHTVLALRMPENGFADRATDALKDVTAEKLRDWGDLAVDIAAGLGERVVVLGISAGGTVAAWIGQNRGEVARVVLVAPLFGLSSFGAAVNAAIMHITLFLPNVSFWKDPVLRERYRGLPHGYLRQSSRGTGEVLRLARAALVEAQHGRPAAGAAALVLNASDTAVDNGLARRFAAVWQRRGLPVMRYEFARSHRLGHEIIDPLEPGADPGITYPVLVALIEGREPDRSVSD